MPMYCLHVGWVDRLFPQFYTWGERYGNGSELEGDCMIDDFIKLIPASLMDQSGEVFNSGRQTFESPSDLYILGANPGGAPRSYTKNRHTLRKNVENVLHRSNESHSPYRDNKWGKYAPGNHPMQRGLLHLFGRIDRRPEEVPASEVVFIRSKDLTDLGDFGSIAEQCWPFHQAVIDKLDVKVIVCLGKTAGRYVRHKVEANDQVCTFVEKNRRRWRSYLYKNKKGIFVAMLTHPSQAEWKTPAADSTHLVVKALTLVRK